MPKKTEEKKAEEKKLGKITQKDFEKKVLELAEKGLTSEKIGEALRREGIHPMEFDKKISKILGNKYLNPDEKNLAEKLERIKKHVENNKGDKRAKRDKEKIFARLRRLKKYFKKL